MQKLKAYLVKNWKTTVAAVVIGVALPVLVNSGVITADTAGLVTTVATALGFAVAKDGDQTGVK